LTLVKLIRIKIFKLNFMKSGPVISTRSVYRGVCINTKTALAGSGSHPACYLWALGFGGKAARA
jgi:hypothetical protein